MSGAPSRTGAASAIGAVLDHAIFPVYVVGSVVVAAALQRAGVPDLLVTPLVVGPLIALTALLERTRPERPRPAKRELSLLLEATHFLFNFEVGYGAALLATELLERALRLAFPPIWPTTWPVALQLVLAVVLYEASSYWQHRLFHHRARLWPFHAFHHVGAHMDLFRGARFHMVDFATVAFLAFLPLVVLGAPDGIVTLLAVLVSALGLVHHGNMRVRTVGWLDYLVCTPAVHRRHHSRLREESDANYGNTVMMFDLLWGTFARPHPVGPAALGTDEGPLPEGFRAQVLEPFSRASGTRAG